MKKENALESVAKRLRIFSLIATTNAGSGHPTTCLSAADLLACLFFDEMAFNPQNPDELANDELVLSKGHAAPIIWAAYVEAGIISHQNLMNLRKISSVLEGHPTPRMKWIKVATGSLGQGLSVGVGMALGAKLRGSPSRTFVLMGDGECAEGAVWEAANTARERKLSNLWAIVDVNRLGQSDETMHGHDLKAYQIKFQAFGWETFSVDGHNIPEILSIFKMARKSGKPVAIIARTIKGKGVSFLEGKQGWHGKPLKQEELERALNELGPLPEIDARKILTKPSPFQAPLKKNGFRFPRTDYKDKVATRKAYGNALVKLGKINQNVVALDGDVKNSTYAEDFFESFPERAIQCYIAEQNMAGIGLGLATKRFLPFMASFAAFLTRAHDQIRMSAYSFASLKFVGSHAGTSIGEDGPSQMGLEDLAMFRSVPGCVVLYPSDGYSAEGCLESMARYKGMAYLRTTRPATPLLYDRKEKFPIGGCKVLKKSSQDQAVVVGAGITVFEALKAYEELQKEDISICVIDAYSVQPLDVETLRKEANEAGGRVVVVEDHYPAGGLGEAVASALTGKVTLVHLAVSGIPRSAKPQELMEHYGISAIHIKKAVKNLL